MDVRYFEFTVPMLEATAGSAKEFDIPNSALSHARILGFRVVAPAIDGATSGGQALAFGWKQDGDWIEAFSVSAPPGEDLVLTGGIQYFDANLYQFGDLANCVGDEAVPLKGYYRNLSDADQTVDVTIQVVVGYEVV